MTAPAPAPSPSSAPTPLSPALYAAYIRAEYVVQPPGEPEFVLRVGQAHPDFDVWLEALGADTWAFITACNPRSEPLSPHQNAERMAALAAELAASGRRVVPGVGRDSSGTWSEPSVCVLMLSAAEAVELGIRYGQNAVVVGRRGSAPTLLGAVATLEIAASPAADAPPADPLPTQPADAQPASPWVGRAAVWFLVLATFLWGSTFALVPNLMDKLDGVRMAEYLSAAPSTADIATTLRPATPQELEVSPALARRFRAVANLTPIWFCLIRFALVSVILGLVVAFNRRRIPITRRTWRYGLFLALLFFVGFLFQTYGLQSVSPSMSAFLTTLYVPLTPILAWLLWRSVPRRSVVVGLALALLGITIMAMLNPAAPTPDAASSPSAAATPSEPGLPFIGEILSALCAIAFAGHILLTDFTSKRENPVALTFCMMAWTAVLCVLPLPAFATSDALVLGSTWRRVVENSDIVLGLGFMVLGPTLFSFWAMTQFQRYVDPSRAGLIYALEPVFALGVSLGVGQEKFAAAKVLGGVLIVGGNIVAESKSPRPARWFALPFVAARRGVTMLHSALTRRWNR